MPGADGIFLRLPATLVEPLALPPPGLQGLRFSALLRAVLAFHAALLSARARLRAEAPGPEALPEALRAQVTAMAAELEALMQAQREQARRLSERQAALLREAQYVMCALADDLLLYEADWPGHALWREELLESRMFGTRLAGERFFERAARIAARGERDGAELAPVYLLALCLGFRGRHRGPEGEAALHQHARALFETAAGHLPDAEMRGGRLAPMAVASVQRGEARLRRRPPLGWPMVAAGVLSGFLLLSTALWFWQTAPVWHAAEAVFQAAR